MAARCKPHVHAIAVALAIGVAVPQVLAQQERAPWQTETNPPSSPSAPSAPPIVLVPPNTTVVPRSAPEAKPAVGAALAGQVSLVAVLTQDGQNIEAADRLGIRRGVVVFDQPPSRPWSGLNP